MPLIQELLRELKIPEDYTVYGSVVMGYPAQDSGPAQPRKDVFEIIS
jgi:hypothetical protein